MKELRLHVRRNGLTHEVNWEDAPSDSKPRQVVLPTSRQDYRDYAWYLEAYPDHPGAGDHARARLVEKRLAEMGAEIRELLGDEVASAPPYSLMTIVSDDPEALAMPWELATKGSSLPDELAIRRQLESHCAIKVSTPPFALPIRVLVVVARPNDRDFLDSRNNPRAILLALEPLAGRIEVEFCEPPTVAELQRRILGASGEGSPYGILHFDGHGVEENGSSGLCFEDAQHRSHFVTGCMLKSILQGSCIPVAVLDACESASIHSTALGAASSPAVSLLRAGIGSVVGFAHAIRASATALFSDAFYRSLAHGLSVSQAVREGRRRLHEHQTRRDYAGVTVSLQDWSSLRLFQQGEDPRIQTDTLNRVRFRPRRAPPKPSSYLQTTPKFGFVGRAWELHQLKNLLLRYSRAVVTAMDGVGKSTLVREATRWWCRAGLRPDGAVGTSCESRVDVAGAITEFVSYFEPQRTAGHPEAELFDRAIKLFRTRAVVWVWDHFDDAAVSNGAVVHTYAEQLAKFRTLIEALFAPQLAPPLGWIIVVARSPRQIGSLGLRNMEVPPMPINEATELVQNILDGIDANRDLDLKDEPHPTRLGFVPPTGGLPLSIELLAPHIQGASLQDRQILSQALRSASQSTVEARNQSLASCLNSSLRALSPTTLQVLPSLVTIVGNILERNLVRIMFPVDPIPWSRIREELLDAALIRIGDQVGQFGYQIWFHPALDCVLPAENKEPLEARFLKVYWEFAKELGSDPAAMRVREAFDMEEHNLRRAIRIANGRNDDKSIGLTHILNYFTARWGQVGD